MSNCKKFLVIVVLSFIQINVSSQNLIIDRVTETQSFHDTISNFWLDFKPYVVNSIDYTQVNTYNLYQVQITTNVLLRYAFSKKNFELVDDLLEVYMIALTTLDTLDRYKFTYFYPDSEPRDTILRLDKSYTMWIDGTDEANPSKENILAVSQFLAMVSDAIFKIALLSPELRTDTMKSFVSQYSPILDSHYKRWVYGINVYNLQTNQEVQNVGPFQRRGWGCKYNNTFIPTHLTHLQLIDLLDKKECGDNSSKKYCNSVTDTDLWIIAGVSNFVAAYLVDSELIKKVSNLDFYKGIYLPAANRLLISRISSTVVLDFNDSQVWGADFDIGLTDDYPDNKFAGYDNPNVYPTVNDISWSQDLGWDFSHSRRFVDVFQSLYDTKSILGFDFPSKNIMVMLANQYAYRTFNKDFEYPLFSNYFDGTNGWYRVGYSNRLNFGYGPSDLSISSLTGGFSYWNVYNPDVRKISNSLYCLINSNDSLKRTFLNQHYEKTRWNNDTATNLPIREQLHDFHNNLTLNQDSATLFVLLSFYSSIGISDSEISADTEKLDDIVLYPNPSTDQLFIMSESNICEVSIIDSDGHQVYFQKFYDSFILINTNFLGNGFYIVNIKTENNSWFNKKIIIN